MRNDDETDRRYFRNKKDFFMDLPGSCWEVLCCHSRLYCVRAARCPDAKKILFTLLRSSSMVYYILRTLYNMMAAGIYHILVYYSIYVYTYFAIFIKKRPSLLKKTKLYIYTTVCSCIYILQYIQ
jgi:hypothetical protein